MALFLVTACTNDEPASEDQQQTEESQSITTALNRLNNQFDDYGNIIETDNPAGNVVFDFCFDFVYPLTLSYNNGTTVTVNDLDGIIDIILSSTDDLYISGVAFPFDVETFNNDTDAIEIVTINNEEEFIDLLESCDFDDFETCECTEEYNPVCVEVSDPNGETFTITYPNACFAECDGFTEDDFLESCEDDYNCPGGNGCFEFNFPITIITDDNETVTVNSQEELDSVLYDAYYFDFVYPFTVTLNDDDDDDDEIVTINSAEDLEELIEECFDDYDDGNYDCEECEDEPIEPVCIEYTTASGETIVEVFPNMCFALCLGFSQEDVVECENNPSYCSDEDLADYLEECEWLATSSLNPNNNAGIFTFSEDRTVSVAIDGTTITGTWELSSNPSTDQVFMFISLPAPYEEVSNLDWTVVECNEDFILLESNNEFLSFESSCD
mgnify:CR=1 FL=1